MGILDDVMINVKSAAEVVGKKAGQIVDITKLRINVSELNNEINKRYMELGQSIYEAKKNGEVNEDDVAERIAEIDDLIQQLNLIVQEIGALQNKTTCPVCGRQCPVEAAYCLYCGAKLTPPAAEPDEPAEPAGEAPAEPEAPSEEDEKPEE